MASASAIATPRERPILFSAPMVRAILEGRKTQTRRVVKVPPGKALHPSDPPHWIPEGDLGDHEPNCEPVPLRCPYGAPGDRLRMLTTWAVGREWDKFKPSNLPDFSLRFWSLFDCTPKPDWAGKSRPGRFLPLSLRHRMPLAEVTGVRVERLNDISEDDAKAEGVEPVGTVITHHPDGTLETYWSYRAGFANLWEDINGAGSWDANPWCWVVAFRRLP